MIVISEVERHSNEITAPRYCIQKLSVHSSPTFSLSKQCFWFLNEVYFLLSSLVNSKNTMFWGYRSARGRSTAAIIINKIAWVGDLIETRYHWFILVRGCKRTVCHGELIALPIVVLRKFWAPLGLEMNNGFSKMASSVILAKTLLHDHTQTEVNVHQI